MIDRNIILSKTSKVDHHLQRIKKKIAVSQDEFLGDLDLQEIILFNLQMAIQNCVDLSAHIISDEELGIAGSTGEMFYLLQENGYLSPELTEKMVAAAGFRNIIAHEYGNLDLKQVYQIANQDINDVELFIKAILKKCHVL